MNDVDDKVVSRYTVVLKRRVKSELFLRALDYDLNRQVWPKDLYERIRFKYLKLDKTFELFKEYLNVRWNTHIEDLVVAHHLTE